jgi:hypothetical protein
MQQKVPEPPIKILRTAAIALLTGAGFAVIFAFFWPGIVLIYLSAVVLAIDFLCEKWDRIWRFGALLIPIGLVGLVSLWAFGSAPLEIQFHRHYGNFKEGEVIGGIVWKDTYSELRVVVSNPTSNDYQDFDALIATDLWVANTGLMDAAPTRVLRIAGPHATDVRLKGKDERGNPIEQLMSRLALTGPHLLHCDKLLKHDTVQAVFALVNASDKPQKPDVTKPESFLGPKKLAKWASVNSTYTSLFRPYSFSEKKELAGD